MIRRIALLVLTSTLTPLVAHAGSFRPMVEVGGGAETATGGSGLNVLLRVNAGLGWRLAGSDLPGVDQLIIAHIDGTMAVNPADDGERIPYMNIRFIPVVNPQNIPNPGDAGWPQTPDSSPGLVLDTGPGQRLFINLVPAGFQRETRAGRDLAVRVSLVGLELGTTTLLDDDMALFLQISAELLGWKMVEQNGGYGTMHGFRVGGASLEIGMAFKIASQFVVRIGVGGSADVAFGGGSQGATIQSDQEAYARLAFDITRFIQLSARAGIVNFSDTNFDSRSIYQFMTGLSVRFE